MTAYDAARSAVALGRDRFSCLSVTGADRTRFLHNQTTNSLQPLAPGQGCETVFVTATARTLDLVTAYVRTEEILLLVSPGMAQSLMEWMDRYIFFADQVTPANLSKDTFTISLVGPQAAALLESLGLSNLPKDLHHHSAATLANAPITVAAGSGLALPGFTLVGSAAGAAGVWQALSEAGALPLDEADWERLRVEQGRPAPGHELTEDDNPLEAGLWQAVSFSKGCYIGQEAIARLNTYKGVKKRLWGLQLSAAVAPQTPLHLGNEKVGKVTTALALPDGSAVGLGYVRTKAGGSGLSLTAGAATATVVSVPFLSHDYPEGD